ncbi:PEBP-like protein [Myriangium duriaei CBS 260.36]|uniref:PEBP-like protein n=1 Tax=Myriangium duriaei CBS 260.36 TaxID=1168546 RepID=A0A9P4ISW1_9PEZI|nr:PEBP-like protein [Myriangium duriaei CBS 260.36]
MLFNTLLLAGLAVASPMVMLEDWQFDQVVLDHKESNKGLNQRQQEIIAHLHLSEIIPTVLDDFLPLLDVGATWGKKTNATLGNTVKPKKLKHEPDLSLLPLVDSSTQAYEQFVTVLTDPDAKSRDDPKWAEMCHWIAYWSAGSGSESGEKKEIVPYKAPAPPPKTWKHRYVLVVLTPLNGTKETLHLAAPKDRQHWGYGGVREGVRRWGSENGLGVVGANFVMAQNKKQ